MSQNTSYLTLDWDDDAFSPSETSSEAEDSRAPAPVIPMPRRVFTRSPTPKEDHLTATDVDDASDRGRLSTIGNEPFSKEEEEHILPEHKLLAEWNGYVNSIQDNGYAFTASLRGVLGEGVQGEDEDAIIPIDYVSEADKELLSPGNFFRLTIVHELLPSGQPRRFSQVVFRRLPAYRQHDLNESAEKAREISRRLRVE